MRVRRSLGVPAVVSLLAILPAFTNIRLGSLQAEDFVLLLLLGFCIARFLCSGFSFRISFKLSGLFRSYGLLLLSILLMAVLALRLTFYPLDEMSFLKQPVIFSLSKLIQLAACICGFLWLTNAFVAEKRVLERAMNLYWRTGIVTSWFAILSWLVVVNGHIVPDSSFPSSLLGAYSLESAIRARGFF